MVDQEALKGPFGNFQDCLLSAPPPTPTTAMTGLLHHAEQDSVKSRICQEIPGIYISRSAFVGGDTITMKSKADEEVGINLVGLAGGVSHLGCA